MQPRHPTAGIKAGKINKEMKAKCDVLIYGVYSPPVSAGWLLGEGGWGEGEVRYFTIKGPAGFLTWLFAFKDLAGRWCGNRVEREGTAINNISSSEKTEQSRNGSIY